MNRKTLLLIVAVLASAALSARANLVLDPTNLVTNPGFETGTFSGWTQFGDTSFTAVSTASFGHTPHSGTYEAHFGPTSSFGGIRQTLATSPGAYSIDFWLSNDDPIANNGFYISFNGTTLFTLTNAPAFPYTHYAFTGTATGSSSVLEFGFYNPPAYYYLDDVNVVVPEPGTLGLVALGALGLVGAVRKRLLV